MVLAQQAKKQNSLTFLFFFTSDFKYFILFIYIAIFHHWAIVISRADRIKNMLNVSDLALFVFSHLPSLFLLHKNSFSTRPKSLFNKNLWKITVVSMDNGMPKKVWEWHNMKKCHTWKDTFGRKVYNRVWVN